MYHLRRKHRQRPHVVSDILKAVGFTMLSTRDHVCEGVRTDMSITVMLNNRNAVFSLITPHGCKTSTFNYSELLDSSKCIQVLKKECNL